MNASVLHTCAGRDHTAQIQPTRSVKLGCGCTKAIGVRCDGTPIEWIPNPVCTRHREGAAAGADQSPVVARSSSSGLGVSLTKTRLELLQAVADRLVFAGHGEGGSWQIGRPDERNRYVDVRCREAHRAGWIALDPAAWGGGSSRRYWHLTDFGRAVLDGAR